MNYLTTNYLLAYSEKLSYLCLALPPREAFSFLLNQFTTHYDWMTEQVYQIHAFQLPLQSPLYKQHYRAAMFAFLLLHSDVDTLLQLETSYATKFHFFQKLRVHLLGDILALEDLLRAPLGQSPGSSA